MFESVDDADVLDAMGSAACGENAACWRRLKWMGELHARRAPEDEVRRDVTGVITTHFRDCARILDAR